MSWQSRIYHKYRLDEKGLKILSDFTGLMVHPAFIKFLEDEKKPVTIAQNIPEIVNNQTNSNLIILCLKYQIPSFISLKTEVIYFDFSDIPVNGHPGLFKDISADSLVSVLDYLDEKQPHLFIAESELSELLIKAAEFKEIKTLKFLEDEIQSGLNLPTNADNLLALAEVWAAIQYTSYKLKETTYSALKSPIDEHCNPYFTHGKWQEAFYAPVSNPKTVDKLIHRIKQENAPKKALLCFDCMGLPEWLLLKDYLAGLKIEFEEKAVFTLLPSTTEISRSAIFAGSYEVYHRKNSGQSAEEKDLKNFFESENTIYLREKDYIDSDTILGYDTVSVLFNFFDELSHSTIVQASSPHKFSYYNAVVDYLKNSKVKRIVQDLLESGFTVYLCSDHGSTIAAGNGDKLEKYLHDKFAKRAVLISKSSAVLTNYEKVAIPFVEDKMVVIPKNREMFASKNQIEITHGGISIEEMVVPFIKIKNKE